MYYQNVNGLRTKTGNLFYSTTDCFFDVICLTETWLHCGIADSEIFNSSYNVYRRDRHLNVSNAPVGGGVLIAVKASIGSTSVAVDKFPDVECCCTKINMHGSNAYICNFYIPPGRPFSAHNDMIGVLQYVSDLCSPLDDLIVVGDFNLPHLEWSFSDAGNFLIGSNSRRMDELLVLDDLSSLGLQQVNGVFNTRQRLLDLIFVSEPSRTHVGSCLDPISNIVPDHPALHISISNCKLPSDISVTDYFRNFRKADFNSLDNNLSNVNWSEVYNFRDIDLAVAKFYQIVLRDISGCVPLVRKKHCLHSPPWYDSHLRSLRNRRNNAWTKYKTTNDHSHYLQYSGLRREFNQYSMSLYCLYLDRVRSSLRSNPKELWNFVNNKRKTSNYPSVFTHNDESVQDPSIISDLFANYFGSVFSDDDDCDIDLNFFKHMTCLPNISSTFILDADTVLDYINKIDEDFSDSPDEIPSVVIRKCSLSLVEPLTFLFNLSLRSGVFPALWKKFYVVPVHKKGRKDLIENYRPIAKLSPIPKVFEAIICDYLSFSCRSILSSKQHGFIKGRSTVTNLVEFSSFCLNELERGNQVDCVYTDFTKAFDKLSHKVLNFKLENLGLHSHLVQWIRSYLSQRSFRIRFSSYFSRVVEVTSGVPQGSHLGPLLFTLFLNDLFQLINHSNILAYADDIKIFKSISNINDLLVLQSDLSIFSEWCLKSHMTLNTSKCFIMTFTKKSPCFSHQYELQGNPLIRCDSITDLGVVLDPKLTFQAHFESIINRSNSSLGFIRRWSRELHEPYVLKSLFCAFVRPILEYASVVWSPHQSVHISRIESIQKRFLRLALSHLPWQDRNCLPPYLHRLKLLGMSPLHKRREVFGAVFFHDLVSGNIDSPSLLTCINFNSRPRLTRAHNFIYPNYHRTDYGFYEPLSANARIYNDNSEIINFNLSRNAIKKALLNN